MNQALQHLRGRANLRIVAARQEIAVEPGQVRRAVAPADNHQALGPGLLNALIAIAVVNISFYARGVRAATLVVRRMAFIEAARTLGAALLAVARVTPLRSSISWA